jgi:MFS family permease
MSEAQVRSGSDAASAGALALAVLCTQQFIMAYDTVSMNVAISTIVVDLNTTLTGVQTVIAMYALVMAAFMVTGAKLADRWGRRRVFTLGALTYGTGAGITALSPSLGVMAFGWSLIEGLGAALVTPAILTLTTVNFAGAARTRAFAAIGAVSGLGAATAPIIAGSLTTYLSWRISFALEVVVVLVVISLRKNLAESRPEGSSSFDWGGVVLSALGFALTVLGVILASTFGFWSARKDMVIGGVTLFREGGISPVPVIVGMGLLVLVLFAAWERWGRIERGHEPLVRLSVLRLLPIRVGVVLMAALFLVMSGILFAVPVFTQVSLSYSAIESGLTMLPLSLSLLIAAFVATRLSARGVAAGRLIRVGFLTLGAGCVVLAVSLVVTATKLSLAPSLILVGLGLGLVLAIIMDFVQSSAPSEQASEVAGFSRSVGYLGSSLGTAVSGAVLIGVLIATGSALLQHSEDLSSGQKKQFVEALESSTQAASDAQVEAALKVEPPEVEQEIVSIYAQARNRGLQAAAAVLGGVSLLAFLLAFRLKATAPRDGG